MACPIAILKGCYGGGDIGVIVVIRQKSFVSLPFAAAELKANRDKNRVAFILSQFC
jgi:hypothetical protein